MNKIKKYESIIIIAFSMLVMLPFINQAYFIDDDIYLTAAIKYNQFGLDSFKGSSEQEGYIFPNYYLTHPLLWPWMIAVIIKLFNTTNESVLHLIQLISVIIIGLSALSISRKFSKETLTTALLFISIPAVLLLSHVMMTDIPTLAFFLLALALYLEGIEKNSTFLFILSGLSASAAWGISYQALFIIFLFGFYNFQLKKYFKSYIPIIIPIIFFLLWFLGTWIKFGIPHPLIAFQWGGDYTRNILNDFLFRLIGDINSIGATTIFPLFILLVYFILPGFKKILISSLFLALSWMILIVPEYSGVQKILFAIYFMTGVFIILRIAVLFLSSLKIKDSKNIFISLWFISFFVIVAVAMPLGVARYLLPGLLPVIIVIINDMKNYFSGKNFRYIIYTGLSLSLVYGILCSFSDYSQANTYRAAASRIEYQYKNNNVWFCSDGLKWYMERKGFKPLLYEDTRPVIGDIIVISSELWAYRVPEVMNRTEYIDKIIFDSAFPLRTMNLAAHAGFYDHLEKALLPFSITRGNYEEFFIYEVVR